uniref:PABS domain-containing protein n=1 Tax=Onchocerca volvulus TaxID=6282 RepID=A0A8R1TJM2_ONCVO
MHRDSKIAWRGREALCESVTSECAILHARLLGACPVGISFMLVLWPYHSKFSIICYKRCHRNLFEAKIVDDDLNSFNYNKVWSGQAFSLKVDEVLVHEKSKYQDILIFRSSTYGNVLALDGIIQCTENDEFTYQEMITHLAMFSHPLPRKVLVIGGGDGAVLREEHKNEFDVIITDSSDPIGPAKKLFSQTYYGLIKEALTEKGVLSSQGECPWLDLKFIKSLVKHASDLYPRVAYAVGFVPTYPSGQMGYLLCSKDQKQDLTVPLKMLSESEVKRMNLKYYNSDIHRSAFVLPQFIKEL